MTTSIWRTGLVRLTSLRNAVLVGTLFFRRGRAVTRFLAALVGVLVAVSLCGLFGLANFVTHVGERGRLAEMGDFREGGCVQGRYRYDPFDLDQYAVTLLAATCEDPPVPPGLSRFPKPGEMYVSPEIAKLRGSDASIAARFPRVDGLIGPNGLTGSHELRAITGVEPAVSVAGALPVGIFTFNAFGPQADYLATYLRFNRPTFLIIGLFFTLLPGAFLVAACTRLNARTRERQLGLLTVIGLDATALRRALVSEAVLTVGVGALLGLLVARPLFARATPTFVAWTAFPGDLSTGYRTLPVVFVLVVAMAAAAAWLTARSHLRRGRRRSTGPGGVSSDWRWCVLGFGLLAAAVTHWWHADAAWPVVLSGRVSTFVGLLLVAPLVCAWLGSRLSASDDPVTALVGARLRRPSGSLTRALGALASGLFVLSAGATTIDFLSDDPAAIWQAYSPDGRSVVEVRRPSDDTRRLLTDHDVLTGTTSASTDPMLRGTLTGSCTAVRAVTGGQVTCDHHRLYGITYQGQPPPEDSDATPTPLYGPRGDILDGFVVTLTDRATISPTDDTLYIPLPTAEAGNLYDRLVGGDPTVNVRIAGTATVSGASELTAILDIFRWGAAFAVAVSLLAALISLVALLQDRQPANNYLQILGTTRRQTATVALTEVTIAAGGTVLLALASSVLWALGYRSDDTSVNLIAVMWPFVATLAVLTAAAAALVWSTLRHAGISVVPDRDGLVATHDTFAPSSPVGGHRL
ncbi:hypothetical protein MXD61_09280 [Frankia sp. AgPm24]|uniref:FtsX-like permease family protein n=1 Tax=Frankia sp. AgPm24 TaxID=631128 RepID=UPI00200DF85D|nr:FtsX-like permease family protein [Frankia sp. AgPm24]MCK9922072.1 hypothetical protein [Frankia sp. AgPm24]